MYGKIPFYPRVLLFDLMGTLVTSNREFEPNISMETKRKYEFIPGAVEFLEFVSKYWICGLVTNSAREKVFSSPCDELLKYFSGFVCQEDTFHPKPAPDPYLLMIQKLEVYSKDCIAFEDSDEGVLSATQAGIYCIRIEKRLSKFSRVSVENQYAELIRKFSEIKNG